MEITPANIPGNSSYLQSEIVMLKRQMRALENDNLTLKNSRDVALDDLRMSREAHEKTTRRLKKSERERDQAKQDLGEMIDEVNGMNRPAAEVHAEEAAAQAKAIEEAQAQAEAAVSIIQSPEEDNATNVRGSPSPIQTPDSPSRFWTGSFVNKFKRFIPFVGQPAQTAPIQRTIILPDPATSTPKTASGATKDFPHAEPQTPESPSAAHSRGLPQHLAEPETPSGGNTLAATQNLPHTEPAKRNAPDVPHFLPKRKRANRAQRETMKKAYSQKGKQERAADERRLERESDLRVRAEEIEKARAEAVSGTTEEGQILNNSTATPNTGEKRKRLVPIDKLRQIPSGPSPGTFCVYYDLPGYKSGSDGDDEDMLEVDSDVSMVSERGSPPAPFKKPRLSEPPKSSANAKPSQPPPSDILSVIATPYRRGLPPIERRSSPGVSFLRKADREAHERLVQEQKEKEKVTRAREQAEKHKPKTPSRLRTTSRLSSPASTIVQDATAATVAPLAPIPDTERNIQVEEHPPIDKPPTAPRSQAENNMGEISSTWLSGLHEKQTIISPSGIFSDSENLDSSYEDVTGLGHFLKMVPNYLIAGSGLRSLSD